MTSNENNLEYAVSQAVDGVLADADRRRLGDALHTDDARQFAVDHGELKALLRTNAAVPEIDFDAFANSFTATLAAEEGYAPAPLPMWPVWRRRLSVAAAIMLAGAAAWPFLPSNPRTAGPVGTAIVQVSNVTAPAKSADVAIQVGPSQTMVDRGMTAGLTSDKTLPPMPKIVISSANVPGDMRPY